MPRSPSPSISLLTLLLFVLAFLAGCATSLGPGYIVLKQTVQVLFSSQPEPHIHITAEYHFRNTGTRPLDSLDARLPGRRFHSANIAVLFQGASIQPTSSENNPRDISVKFPEPWPIGADRSLKLDYDLELPDPQQAAFSLAADAFALPAEDWAPALPQERGVFGFGGVPPSQWDLIVRVPDGFLVHASGKLLKHSAKSSQAEFRFAQTAADLNSFVIAGRYRETRPNLLNAREVHIWTRTELSTDRLKSVAASLSTTLATFGSLFGVTGKSRPPLWIVECPGTSGCLPEALSNYTTLLYGSAAVRSARMVSRDTVVLDLRASAPEPPTFAAPALASGFLGYGQNPGFYEQQPPMSALPAFAAALALEESGGPQVRQEIIRRALDRVPPHASLQSNNDPAVYPAKSLLFFYALQNRVGAPAFQKAIRHMLYARRRRGFDITDLISALEEESHLRIGPFVRVWIHTPGIPDDFRATYSFTRNPAQLGAGLAREATQ